MINHKEKLHNTTLPVMESFYTLQGEGYHTGKAAYFIRLAGCDVGCVWCDVKESWDITKHTSITIDTIVQQASVFSSRIAVVTGGEPLMHNCTALTQALKNVQFATHIETSGAYPISGTWDWVCLSPKKFKAPLPSVLPLANELKVVVFNKTDVAWAEKYAAQVNTNCHLFLQPEWDKASSVLPFVIDYIKDHPKWKLSLQTHKYINIS